MNLWVIYFIFTFVADFIDKYLLLQGLDTSISLFVRVVTLIPILYSFKNFAAIKENLVLVLLLVSCLIVRLYLSPMFIMQGVKYLFNFALLVLIITNISSKKSFEILRFATLLYSVNIVFIIIGFLNNVTVFKLEMFKQRFGYTGVLLEAGNEVAYGLAIMAYFCYQRWRVKNSLFSLVFLLVYVFMLFMVGLKSTMIVGLFILLLLTFKSRLLFPVLILVSFYFRELQTFFIETYKEIYYGMTHLSAFDFLTSYRFPQDRLAKLPSQLMTGEMNVNAVWEADILTAIQHFGILGIILLVRFWRSSFVVKNATDRTFLLLVFMVSAFSGHFVESTFSIMFFGLFLSYVIPQHSRKYISNCKEGC